IPDTVKYAFYAGGAVLLGSVLWTICTTREYPPETLLAFDDSAAAVSMGGVNKAWRLGAVLGLLGVLLLALILHFSLARDLYLLAGMLIATGLLFVWLARSQGGGMLRQIMGDLYTMPEAMRRLAWVQFFSWFALFAMWIYATPVVTAVQFGATDPHSSAYNAGANWVGVLFAAYNGFAALAAIIIPWMARAWGLRLSHLINVCLGGAGLISFAWIHDPRWLLLSMLGVGFAWASILSLPYALLSDNLPAAKMGVYMGIFNFFIVIPQLLAASVLGVLLKWFFHDQPLYALVLGGASLVVAGLCVLRVREPDAAAGSPQSEPSGLPG
ncbi:MAG TPA: MFS transporter, partial [Rhodanobacteraceae bacterium]|nr:MFS transporter [Rhodanobacteraceae bacterium]